ncbi:TPA: hypothetical protein HA238_03870 [Candidatus Micrarchaeota archaeon]|nr:hypothetical protein [Candidatus Micrarchaeota archaeon]
MGLQTFTGVGVMAVGGGMLALGLFSNMPINPIQGIPSATWMVAGGIMAGVGAGLAATDQRI